MFRKNINIYYKINPVGEESNQTLVLIKEGKNNYGILNCPCEDNFYKLPQNQIQAFEEYMTENNISPINVVNKTRPKVSKLLKYIKKAKLETPLPNDLVTEAFSSIGITQ